MKLIGIIGKSGSGKTTLSRMLERDNSIGVIHLDEITNMKSIAKKIPKFMVEEYTNDLGEEFIFLNERIRNMLYKLRENKTFNKIYLNMLRLPQNISIKRQVDRLKTEGKICIIVERVYSGKSFNIQTI